MERSHKSTCLIVATGILIIGTTMLLQLTPGSGWDFRNNLWAPTHLLVTGRSPYNLLPLFENVGAVWMPQVIGALFPLGWLTNEQATALWFGVNIVGLLALVLITADDHRPPPLRLALALLLVGLFPPLLSHVNLGQITLLITLAYLVAAYNNGQWYAPAIVALALAKPQLGVLVVPGLLITRWRDSGFKAAGRFALMVALSAALMTIPLFLADLGWIADFIAAQQGNPEWVHPSLLYTAVHAFGREVGYILWGLLFTGIFAVNVTLWRQLPPEHAIIWSLALTPLVTPYVWSWDFVMLFPLLSWLVFHLSPARLVAFIAGYAVIWYGIIALAFSGDVSNHRYWWIPSALLVLALALYLPLLLLSPMNKFRRTFERQE